MNKTIDGIFFALLFTFALAMSSPVMGQGQASQKMICDRAPYGNFNDPNTIRDGRPIRTMTLKQQVILDVVEGTFTTVNVNAVNEASSFLIGGDKFQLGGEHDQFRTLINGRTNDTGTPAGFDIAGYIVPIEDDKH